MLGAWTGLPPLLDSNETTLLPAERVREGTYWRVRTFITLWCKDANHPHYGAIGGLMGSSNEAILSLSAKEVPMAA